MIRQNKSKLIADALRRNSRLKRDYRKGNISDSEFNDGTLELLDMMVNLTEMFGDSPEIDYVKEVIWFTIESYSNKKSYSRPEKK